MLWTIPTAQKHSHIERPIIAPCCCCCFSYVFSLLLLMFFPLLFFSPNFFFVSVVFILFCLFCLLENYRAHMSSNRTWNSDWLHRLSGRSAQWMGIVFGKEFYEIQVVSGYHKRETFSPFQSVMYRTILNVMSKLLCTVLCGRCRNILCWLLSSTLIELRLIDFCDYFNGNQ